MNNNLYTVLLFIDYNTDHVVNVKVLVKTSDRIHFYTMSVGETGGQPK